MTYSLGISCCCCYCLILRSKYRPRTMSQIFTKSKNVCHSSAEHYKDAAHCVFLHFCAELTFHLSPSRTPFPQKPVIVASWVISLCLLSLPSTVDGDRLVMKGAKLTSREMLSVFQSQCTAKDPQAKTAAKKWWASCYLCEFICIYLYILGCL